MIHICPYCKMSFDGRRNKIFCSRSHSEMWHRKQEYREPRSVPENLTGKCLNCGAAVEIPRLYCSEKCGNRYRQRKYDQARSKHPRRQEAHVCHYTDGVCIRCVNERRRKAFEKNKKYIWGARVACVHHASFAAHRPSGD